MRFYFHEDAQRELDKAVEYYEDCRAGLGLEFAQEVHAAIARVIQFPDAWSPMPGTLVGAWSIGFPSASSTRSSPGMSASLPLRTFGVPRSTGGTGSEQSPSLNLTG
jgi:hypothetical protein